jgi:hypothetical protein
MSELQLSIKFSIQNQDDTCLCPIFGAMGESVHL